MHIARVQVEEGFLNGLDLRLSPGLNVLIGPRGVGKTSVIELIRFCLDVPSMTERAGVRAIEHARAVLGSGQVTVTVVLDGEEVTYSRTIDDSGPRRAARTADISVLSQNEIESVGLDAAGRLRLVDAFREDRTSVSARAAALRAEARSLTVEVRNMWREIDALDEQHRKLTTDSKELSSAEATYRDHLQTLTDASAKQQALESYARESGMLGVSMAVFDRAQTVLSTWEERLVQISSRPPRIETWPEAAGDADPLEKVRSTVSSAEGHLAQALADITTARRDIDLLRGQAEDAKSVVDVHARTIRSELESLREGSGALARRVAELREKSGQAAALLALRSDLAERRAKVIARRDALLDDLDALCHEEYKARERVAEALNLQLGPRIQVSLAQAGMPSSYVDALRAALRGSGLRYNTLAPLLAERLSPRELTTAVESRDVETIADIVGISIDRAARLLNEVADSGAEDIVTCEVQDTVTLSLLDGREYKDSEHLSTGQRCTVVLPLLLSRRRDVLIIDQPEDHLDNAFIVDAVVDSLRRRGTGGQLLLSTHNPNIPVLGGADNVILMGSDGRRGFVRHAGKLEEPASVHAITTVMEGGLNAFRLRSDFYLSVDSRA